MSPNRREFIRQFGVALAGILSASCRSPFQPTCYVPALPSATPGPTGQSTGSPALSPEQERLRACWLELDALAEQTQKDSESGQQTRQKLVGEHRAALDDLVRSGVLDALVAEQVQLAFEQAADHIWATYAPVLCYEEAPLSYYPASRDDLVRQAGLLAEGTDLDPETVALAQTAIARDMAFLGLSVEETQALYDEISGDTGPGTPYPRLEGLELDISPEAVQAARFLVDLLLGGIP